MKATGSTKYPLKAYVEKSLSLHKLFAIFANFSLYFFTIRHRHLIWFMCHLFLVFYPSLSIFFVGFLFNLSWFSSFSVLKFRHVEWLQQLTKCTKTQPYHINEQIFLQNFLLKIYKLNIRSYILWITVIQYGYWIQPAAISQCRWYLSSFGFEL